MGICRSPSTSAIFAKLVNPLLCFVIIIALLYVGQDVLKPVVFSIFIALLLITPAAYFERQGFSRAVAALICLVVALMFFITIFYLISNSIASFREDLPLMIQNLNESLRQFETWIHKTFDVSRQEVHQIVITSTDKVVPSTSTIVNETFYTVTGLFFIGIIVFITTFLVLLYRGLILQFFLRLLDARYEEKVYTIFAKIRFVTKNYIVGLLIEMVIVAIAYCSVMFLLGVKYALLLGIIGAILNIIPYLGIILTCILCALITLTTETPTTVVWVVISIIIIHMLDSNILMVRIVGSKVKLNALTTIVGVITGSALWGIPGTFMAVPILAVMKVTFEEIEALQPFAILMGDDDEVKSLSRPVINRIARSMYRKRVK